MSGSPHSFATRLLSLREERRLSKTALAKMVGVSTTCVWNWEEGNTAPRPENMLSLSKALSVSVDRLEFGRRDSESENASPYVRQATLPEVISMAKMEIATLAGIDPSKVKISLDY